VNGIPHPGRFQRNRWPAGPVWLSAVFLFLWAPKTEPPAVEASAAAQVTLDRTGTDSSSGESSDPGRPKAASVPEQETARVESVIDGDTVIVEGNRAVRVLGVDTPERGEPFYGEARDFQKAACLGRNVRLLLCPEERHDKYGRILAFLDADHRDPGAELLSLGLARTLFIGSCALPRASDYRRREREAFRSGRGFWSLQNPRSVPHGAAGKYAGRMMTVTGKVVRVHEGPRAVHLNFGPDYRTDFTAVIYRKDLSRLSGEGLLLPVTGYQGRKVSVTGVIRAYNGPEIIVRDADQVRPGPEE
jgi:micrococcal nuclease